MNSQEDFSQNSTKAENYAYRLLQYRPRSSYEISSKLAEKKYAQQTIKAVIDKLTDYGYINDSSFAQMWIKDRCLLKPTGRRLLWQELRNKGISQEIIEAELAFLTPEKEFEMALALVNKKLRRGNYSRGQITGFLSRRGFSGGIISKIIFMISAD